jgi:hypothetical protein
MDRVRASGQPIAVGPAIPFWLDGITLDWRGARKPASEHVQDIFDYVALMDYRDHAAGGDGMIAHAAGEMAYAERTGKTVVAGVETSPNELAKVSFDHLSPADMERELGLVEQAFVSQRAFGGFALHHYASYRRWLQRAPRRP